MIQYPDRVKQIKAIKLDAHDPRLFHILGEISSDEDAAGRGMLSVVVVHKAGDIQPGPGFFELAKQLGRSTSKSLGGRIARSSLNFVALIVLSVQAAPYTFQNVWWAYGRRIGFQ